MMSLSKKTAVYICTGCRIGDALDTSKILNELPEEFSLSVCKSHNHLCSLDGVRMIEKDIQDDGIQSLVLAACSARYKTGIFSFDPEIPVERVNLREQVAWTQNPDNEDTRMMAMDYLRMGINRADTTSVPGGYVPGELNADILVIGAGISGLTAAIEISKTGYRVILIEKERSPGGFAARLHRQLPADPPWNKPVLPEIHSLIEKVVNSDRIELHCSSEVRSIGGEPGNFIIEYLDTGNTCTIRAGAIIQATGWKPYDPLKIKEYNYGSSPDIITNIQFEEMAREGAIKRPSDGMKIRSILFVQCAGSRNKDHLPYCSTYCCNVTLKQALYVRETNADAQIFIVYKDIRTPGAGEFFYHEVQKEDNIFMTKGEVKRIYAGDGVLHTETMDALMGKDICLKTDLVVLAMGMVPEASGSLHLNYRQGPELPDLKYGFPDSHYICFPYETRRTGIYSTGTVRAPMDIVSSKEDAAGAALKAIQCFESTKRGESVHPRSGDRSFPELYMPRCTDCKRCTEECPFGVYDETENGTPILNPSRCRRCGICMGSCPERIINFADFSIQSVSAMIKSIEIPPETEEKFRILVFACENDAIPAFDMAGHKKLRYSPFIRIIPVRCIGNVNAVWISDAFSQGFDGVLQIGCKPGEDYQCHFILGSELTQIRNKNIQDTLNTMMLEPERVQTEFIEITEYYRIPEIINGFAEQIRIIGANPFKGM